jgi:hypothetical protein
MVVIVRLLALLALLLPVAAQGQSRAEIERTMRRATGFMVENVADHGGYVWTYLPDLSRRWGEMEAEPGMIWVQAPGSAASALVGTYANDRFVGWWCQEPSRVGPDDAGQVELHFVRGDKRILMEGIWTYGDGRAAAWQNNFYGVSLETPSSYKLEQRMQHHVGCPGH